MRSPSDTMLFHVPTSAERRHSIAETNIRSETFPSRASFASMEKRTAPRTQRQTEGLKGLVFNWMRLLQVTFSETLQASNPPLFAFSLASNFDAR